LPPRQGRHQEPVWGLEELLEELEDGTRPFLCLLRRQEEEAHQVITITPSTAAITILITPAAILTLRRQW
jgi:hypothetical protein